MEDMLSESIAPLLADLCTPTQLRKIESERPHENGSATAGSATAVLWESLEASGFLDALVPEAKGGAGLSLDAVAGVFIALGHAGMPLPAAQTMVARQLLAESGTTCPEGPLTLAFTDVAQADTVQPNAAHQEHGMRRIYLPYGATSDAFLLETPEGVFLHGREQDEHKMSIDANARQATSRSAYGIAVDINAGTGHLVKARTAMHPSLLSVAGLLSAASMAGTMTRIFEMTMTQANERQQFGRSIGKFQAVQHQLSVMAEHIAATHMAVRLACATVDGDNAALNRAIAKSRASHAAPLIADTAHALMGAIGITAEFDLQLFTRRLRAERLHYGSEGYWDEVIGAHVIAHWPSITSGIVDAARCVAG